MYDRDDDESDPKPFKGLKQRHAVAMKFEIVMEDCFTVYIGHALQVADDTVP